MLFQDGKKLQEYTLHSVECTQVNKGAKNRTRMRFYFCLCITFADELFFADIIKLVVIFLDYVLLLTRRGATLENLYFKFQQFSLINRHP